MEKSTSLSSWAHNLQRRLLWRRISETPSIEAVTLRARGSDISPAEIEEIVSILPEIKGKRILDIGAGIGRFTHRFCQEAEEILAIDYCEKFLVFAQQRPCCKSKITTQCEDILKAELPPQHFDLVFSNWILMYLDDVEVRNLLLRINLATKSGGQVFFRESCQHPRERGNRSSDDWSQEIRELIGHTNYREEPFYLKLLAI